MPLEIINYSYGIFGMCKLFSLSHSLEKNLEKCFNSVCERKISVLSGKQITLIRISKKTWFQFK